MGAAPSISSPCQCHSGENEVEDVEVLGLESFEETTRVTEAAEDPENWGVNSKIRRSLLLERKLHSDTEIMRGISLMHTLRNFGVLWRASPLDMKDEQRLELWNRTRKVNEFDVFLSHTWHTRGLWKFLSLSLQLSWLQILLWWLLAMVLFELLFFVDILPPLAKPWKVSYVHQNYAAEIDWHIWGSSLAPAVSVMCFLITPYMPCMRDKHCFLDVASINQSDETLKERGIYGLGGFLKASKELRIMWSPPYLSRLWCIFEVAAYRMANPNGKISVRPLFVEITVLASWTGVLLTNAFLNLTMAFTTIGATFGIFTLIIAMVPCLFIFHSLRKNFLSKQQLFGDIQNFDLDAVECRVDFDKKFVHAAIAEWYGGAAAFTEHVRGPLREELMKDHLARIPLGYCLIIITPLLGTGLSSSVSLLKAGVPMNITLSYFIGVVLGIDTCWLLLMIQLALYICERFARPCRPGVACLAFVETFIMFIVFSTVATCGAFLAFIAIARGVVGSSVWCLITACILWLVNGGCAQLEKLRHHLA
ncbi:unnamed protein product [Durusdinium trenchii]|uniref:Uncharacterized protein n=1 Tax=Durusdinium trenchii TaxID=1381693 RepID=A0ABP0PAA4_9DINO